MEFSMITTRGGDEGVSSLSSGERRPKDDLVFEVLGDLDELVSWLGVLKASLAESEFRLSDVLEEIQRRLFVLGAQVASVGKGDHRRSLSSDDVEELEKEEADLLRKIPPLRGFVLPGESLASGYADLARAVCRRVERSLVRYIRARGMTDLAEGQRYLNRLSDYLFVLARYLGGGRIAPVTT
ncbi:cob(I)yrinic acid a,c-diamide adenosyltransferase [Spirochaeta thermophila]|uniref:Corrinoid adenosyltransferase n=1 Tax=Winmispira thermophila (strain ATCC 49972 / DSM 6192 / RI 19.B1) TaxID=665571 RepID=E0RSH2_WINT6|nr:cob(I)yrinic acid a,c-diamide adenosyltransferase [Spirochaeta thermophila]ADN01959.1 hypothetical protein STHERM_c10130 [Spirochaeta thermophila DSM 6192]